MVSGCAEHTFLRHLVILNGRCELLGSLVFAGMEGERQAGGSGAENFRFGMHGRQLLRSHDLAQPSLLRLGMNYTHLPYHVSQ